MQDSPVQGNKVFDDAYARLNPAQKKAVDALEGPVMVIAGPGTGKTQILTLRIANILKQTDTPPDAILALTFTNSGCRAMRERLVTFIGNDAYRVGIYTFHGYAAKVIEDHPSYFPRIIGARAADDVELYDVVRAVLARVGDDSLLPSGDREYYVRPVLKLIGTLKSDACSPEAYSAYIETLHEEKPSGKLIRSQAFIRVYEEYERELRARGLYDYNDMLLELISTLERERELRLTLSESAQYILADEHQDANHAQNRILELLAEGVGDIPNMFIVGDEKQAIYRFQGASLENFLYFKERYTDATLIPLTENYRSTARILAASGKLIEGHTRFESELSATKGEGDPLTMIVAKTETGEVDAVANMIKELVEKGIPVDEIAILLRKNRDVDAFSHALRAREIPFVSHRDTDALEVPEVLLILSLIKASVDPYDDEALARALFLPAFHTHEDEISALLHERSTRRVPLYDLILENEHMRPVHSLFSKMQKEAYTRPALETLDTLVRESGFLSEALSSPDMADALEAYRALHTLIGNRTRGDSKTTLANLAPLFKDLERGVAPLPYARVLRKGVHIMTLHRAKGLEFDYVFMPHALESRFRARADRSLFYTPPSVNVPEPDENDERRLFYVGLTRARERLIISRHELRNDEREEQPASFVLALPDTEEVRIDGEDAPRIPSVRTQNDAYTHIIDVFLSHGISATALNAYLRDPWTCFIESILRMPHAEAPHQAYGSAVHAAFEQFFIRLGNTKEIPEKEILLGAFTEALSKRGLSKRDFDTFLKRGTEALSGYFDTYKDSFNANVETEVSIAAELAFPSEHARDNVVLRGFLDKVEMLEGDSVRVIDYKTGTPKSRNEIEGKTKSSDGTYKRQLVFYALLLELEGKRRMAEGVIDFIEPNARGIHKKEAFVITEEDIQGLKEEIMSMTDELVRGSFIEKTCESEDLQVRALATILRERFLGTNKKEKSI